MKKQVISAVFIFFMLVVSPLSITTSYSVSYTYAGSPSSGEIPPPGGGEDTGGGSSAGGLYLNYRLPLLFRSGPFGPTIVKITSFYDEVPIIFGFESVEYESTVYINANQTLILNSATELNMENGSLIQTFVPLQINVYHQSETDDSDDTFSYSPLVMSMWGDEYQSPHDNMKAKIVAGFNNSEVTIITPGETDQTEDIDFVGQTIDVDVMEGSIIRGSGPIGVVFYSLSLQEGSFAFTAIPHFLWGTQYYIYPPPDTDLIPLLQGDAEITLSTLGEGGNAIYQTDLDDTGFITLPNNGTATLTNDLITPGESFYNISFINSNFSLSILYNYTINGTAHKSGIQYIAPINMKYAEFFYTAISYSNQRLGVIVLQDGTDIVPMYVGDNGTLIYDLASMITRGEGSILTYYSNDSLGIIAMGQAFSNTITSAPENENWNSSANILYPMNIFSYFSEYDENSTDIYSWYRFPNLNVKDVIVSPENATEFRRLQIDFTIQNNGTILSAPFWVSLALNDTIKLTRQIESLDVDETFDLQYDEFQGFGLRVWNVSITVDAGSQIYELYEFDNTYQIFIIVSRNWNVIYTGIAIAVGIVLVIFYIVSKRIRKYVKSRKRRFDVILSDIEV
ncbi:MAG: hypothetical protein GOP50_03635 [Candidatus Heimdallarchaeota archaeon]|nr:hypothetical protein [Candidatus Heimdallarchaeota archaeon]